MYPHLLPIPLALPRSALHFSTSLVSIEPRWNLCLPGKKESKQWDSILYSSMLNGNGLKIYHAPKNHKHRHLV